MSDKERIEEDPRRISQNSEMKIDSNVIILPQSKRWILFFLMAATELLTNIDHGAIPAATAQIRTDLDISDTILGLFGSAVYVGTILGSLLSISLINVSNRKYLLVSSIILSGVFLFLFTIKQHHILLFINRGIVGLFQTFLSIYFPVWTDQFGDDNKKTIMLAMIQLSSPLGIVLGFAMTTFFSQNCGWKMSFIIESISTIALALILGLFNNIYFKSSIRQSRSSERKSLSPYFYDEDSQSNENNHLPHQGRESKGILNLFKQFKVIFKEPIYIFSVLTLSALLYIATCVQYWASDYMLDTLGIESEKKRLAAFVFICLTSSTFGVIIIGIAISCFGGYESKNSTAVCLCFCILLSLSSIPIPLVDNFFWCAFCLWLLLFFGGGIVAPLNGIIITSVPKEYAGSANSISHLLYNIFGKLPAPYVYGIIKTNVSGRVAMMFSMYMSFLTVAFLAVTTYFRNKHYVRIQRYALVSEDLKQNIETDANNIELSGRKQIGDKPAETLHENNNEIKPGLCGENNNETQDGDKHPFDIEGGNTGVSVV